MQIRDQKQSPKMNRLFSLILPSANQDELISQLLKVIKEIFKASICWISITINGSLILKSYGSASVRNKLSRSELLTKLTPEILKKAYPVLHNGRPVPINLEKFFSQFLREQNFHNLMGVPLKHGTKVFGTLNVVRKNESAGYNRTDLKLLSSFGRLFEMSFNHSNEKRAQPSERKKLEELSKSEKLKVNQVTSNIGVGLALISKDFRTLWANDVLIGIFGKVEGGKCYSVYNRRSKVCPGCGVREILKTGKSEIKHEQEGKDKYGNTIWSQIIATPIKDKDGKISSVMEVVVPITKHKLIENELVQKERIARERAQLLNDLRFFTQEDQVLNRACQAIRSSGLFERAVMTLHDASRQITHLGQVGLSRRMIQLARKAPPLDLKQIKRIMNNRFRISDSFFVPVEAGLDLSQSGRYIPQKKSSPHAGWRIGDELFVPLRDFSGIVMGYLSVDTPTNSCRPDIKKVQSVEMLAEAAASRIRELYAQKATRESDEKYRILVENIKVGIYLTRKGVFINVNESMCRLFGYNRNELIGMPSWNLAVPEKRKLVRDLFFKKASRRDFSPEEVDCLRKDGSRFTTEIRLSDVSEKLQMLGTVSDITNRKRAEEDRHKTEEKYRLVVENANEAIIIAQEGYLRFVNPKMIEILGYSEKELLSKPLDGFIHPADRKMVLERYRRRIIGEDVPPVYDFRVIDKKGCLKWLEINAVAISWEGKLATLNFLTDITKRKQDEQLKEQYQEQKILFELTQALSSATNLDQMLKIATEKVTEFLRIERGSIILVNPDGNSATFKALHVRKGYGVSDLLGFTFKSDSFRKLKELIIKEPFVVNDTSTLPKSSFIRSFLQGIGVKSNLSVSLFYRDKFLGGLTVATKIKYHNFTAEEVRLLQIIANTISTIIVNYQLLEDLKLQAEKLDSQFKEQKMLFELTQALSSATDLIQLRKISVQMVAKIMRAERAAIGVITPKRDACTIQEILIMGKRGDPYSLEFVKPTFAGAIKDMMSKHQPSLVNDTSIYPQGSVERKMISERGIKSAMGVPLVPHKKNIGFLAISSLNQLHHYTPDEVQLLQTLSNPIAMAIENRMLLENFKTQAVNLEKQTRDKDILLKINQALSQTMDLTEVAKVASHVIGTSLDVDRCAIILLTENGNSLEVKGIFSRFPIRERRLVGKQYLIDSGKHWRTIIKRRKVLVINDIAASSNEGIIRERHLKEGLKSLLVSGMFFGKNLSGALALSTIEKNRTFSPDEIKLVQAIANQVATAIENAKLMQMVKTHTQELKKLSSELMKAQEGERKKIAQELHDQVGQMLQTMKLNLDKIGINLPSPSLNTGITTNLLGETEKLLSQTIEDIRTLTFDLRPTMLDDFGLYSTVRWYIEDYARRSNIRVFLKGKEEKYRFPIEIEVNLYRIIQEALTNIVKHANASEVIIFLSRKYSTVILSIKDNGRGFDTNKFLSSPHQGTGIFNMNERVNLLGGSFEIISKPGKGTRINVKIPFTEVKYEEG